MASAGSNSAGSDGEEQKSIIKTIAPTHMSFVRNLTPYSYGGGRASSPGPGGNEARESGSEPWRGAVSPTSKPGNFFEN
jgi:hypothetical protein